MWGIIFYQLWNYCGFGGWERAGGGAGGAGGVGWMVNVSQIHAGREFPDELPTKNCFSNL